MANMCRSRTGDWSVVIGPGLALALGLLYIFVYIFSFSSLVRVVANLRRCLHYHIIANSNITWATTWALKHEQPIHLPATHGREAGFLLTHMYNN